MWLGCAFAHFTFMPPLLAQPRACIQIYYIISSCVSYVAMCFVSCAWRLSITKKCIDAQMTRLVATHICKYITKEIQPAAVPFLCLFGCDSNHDTRFSHSFLLSLSLPLSTSTAILYIFVRPCCPHSLRPNSNVPQVTFNR